MKQELELGKVIRIVDMHEDDAFYSDFKDGKFATKLYWISLTQVKNKELPNPYWNIDSKFEALRPFELSSAIHGDDYIHQTMFFACTYETVSEESIKLCDFEVYSRMFESKTIIKMLNQ